jgi:phosphatidylglycerophosphatase A
VSRLVLSLFGVGRVPGIPGTYASLVTAAALAALRYEGLAPWLWPAVATAVVASAVTLWLAGPAVEASDDGDPSWVVTDEVAGQALAIAFAYVLPGGGFAPCVAAFLFFRAFDVAKPPPIRTLERLPGGLGVLADDWAAGLVAGALVLGARAFHVFEAPVLAW